MFDCEFQVGRGGTPVQEVLRFDALGSKITIGTLLEVGDDDLSLLHGPQPAMRVNGMIVEKLGADYAWIGWARHFASNSLLMEPYDWLLAGFREFLTKCLGMPHCLY